MFNANETSNIFKSMKHLEKEILYIILSKNIMGSDKKKMQQQASHFKGKMIKTNKERILKNYTNKKNIPPPSRTNS